MKDSLTQKLVHLRESWGRCGGFRRSVSVLAGGTALAQVLNFIVSPLLTRIYDARAFGNLQVYGSLLSFAMIVIALRYELAVVLPQNDEMAANVVAVALAVVFGMTGLLSFAVWFILRHPWILPGSHDVISFLWLLPIGAFGVGVYQVLLYWGLRHRAYRSIAVSKLTQVATQAIVQVGAGILSQGALLGLLVGDVFGRVSGSWRIAKITFRNDRAFLERVRPDTMWQAALRYRNYPLLLTGAGLINSAGLQIVPLLLTAHYGTVMVGLYGLVDRTMLAPVLLIAQSTSQVYIVQAAELGEKDPVGLRRLFLEIVRSSLAYGLVPLILTWVFAPSFFSLVFGSSWRTAGDYARILAPVYYFCFAHQCVCMTLSALERQSWQVAWDAFRLVAIVLVLTVSCRAGATPTKLLAAFSVTSCIAYVANLLLCYLAIMRQCSKQTTNNQLATSVV